MFLKTGNVRFQVLFVKHTDQVGSDNVQAPLTAFSSLCFLSQIWWLCWHFTICTRWRGGASDTIMPRINRLHEHMSNFQNMKNLSTTDSAYVLLSRDNTYFSPHKQRIMVTPFSQQKASSALSTETVPWNVWHGFIIVACPKFRRIYLDVSRRQT